MPTTREMAMNKYIVMVLTHDGKHVAKEVFATSLSADRYAAAMQAKGYGTSTWPTPTTRELAMVPNSFNISISTPDARALLALLKTSNTFPDVVEALEEKLDIFDANIKEAK